MSESAKPTRRIRRRWIVLVVIVALLVPLAIVVIPIVTHQSQGSSGQQAPVDEWPTSVSATGDDGRERTLSVSDPDGGDVDTSALAVGDQLVVSGTGYDESQGIYVAICKIPTDGAVKPGPCIGGVPEQEGQSVASGTVQYAASNWINDDWAWKLFGARGYDDATRGTFTAYIEVGAPIDAKLDCTIDPCGLYTRNDHTALSDRVQDLYLPVGFAE